METLESSFFLSYLLTYLLACFLFIFILFNLALAESCHHPRTQGAATCSECEVNAVDQSFTANSHVTLAGSSWLARVDNSSRNNSWSSCTSPSPSSNDHTEEAVGPINLTSWGPLLDMQPSHLQNFPAYVVSELEKRRKTSQGTAAAAAAGVTASEDGIILSAGNSLGDQHHHHQKRKRPSRSLKENLQQLIRQIDLHTSQVINYYFSCLLCKLVSPTSTFHIARCVQSFQAVQLLVLPSHKTSSCYTANS